MTSRNHHPSAAHPGDVAQAKARVAEHVVRAGLKHSRPRDAVIDAFLETAGHHSAEELTAAVRRRTPGIGSTTVYRALKLLVDCGVAEARQFAEGQTRYERVLEAGHHDHLVCVGCGAIFEFEDERIEALQEAVARRHGFEVTHHRMELYGRCRDCASQGGRPRHAGATRKTP
jgi:Fur family transcriptional regulator, ferric uptake regulator